MIKSIEQYCFLKDISDKKYNNESYNEEELILGKFDALSKFDSIFKIILASFLIGLPIGIYSKVFLHQLTTSLNILYFILITLSLSFITIQNLFITKKYMFYKSIDTKVFTLPILFVQFFSALFLILSFKYLGLTAESSINSKLIVFALLYILLLPILSVFIFKKFCLVCKGETLVWLTILPIAIGSILCYLYYFENYTLPYKELLFFSISIIISTFYSFIFLIYIKYLCLTTPFIDNEEFKKLIIYGMDRDRKRQTYSDLTDIDPLH